MNPVPFVDLAAQHRALEAELKAAFARVLAHGNFILGPEVEAFEGRFARAVGAKHAVGVSSGLDALRLALTAAGLKPGDEAIVPANTFIATALAVSALGAKPVLVDCEPAEYGIDPGRIEAALTGRTRVVIPVHLAGQPAEMEPILALARRRGLAVIEDAAQAHGALYRGRPCGTLGALGCFSFYPGKNLGALGDAGLVVTDDAAAADRLRLLRNYGQRVKYEHELQGLNARLDALQAAFLDVKLKRLAGWNAARARHAEAYRERLAGVGDLSFQRRRPDSTHVYHLFIVETGRRDDLKRHLEKAGVGVGIHYPKPIHLQPAYAGLGHRPGDFPEAERLAGRMLSLPMFAELTEAQIERVTGEIRRFFGAGTPGSRKPGKKARRSLTR